MTFAPSALPARSAAPAAALEFRQLPLNAATLANLDQLGFARMTPVQAASLPAALEGADLIVQAPTGSGKTAAFGLALLARLDPAFWQVQALVLCPTRELADQVTEELRRLARAAGNVKILSLCGGSPIRPQRDSLAHGAHIVVGTPGRLMDHLERGTLVLEALNTLVFDEADRMLDMGFFDDMVKVARQCPKARQTLLFSATYPEGIAKLAAQFLKNPRSVTVKTATAAPVRRAGGAGAEAAPGLARVGQGGAADGASAASPLGDGAGLGAGRGGEGAEFGAGGGAGAGGEADAVATQRSAGDGASAAHAPAGRIRQLAFEVKETERLHAVSQLLRHYRPASTLAFCNTKQQCRDLVDVLAAQGFAALALHGDLEQRERDQVLIRFALRSVSVLVATDVAARGLDIEQLEAVINVDVTQDAEVHVHRIGRTGRAGHDGLALSLASLDEMGRIGRIELMQGAPFEWAPLASLTEAPGGPLSPPMAALQILGGRKEKIRPGDVMGALTGEAGFAASQIGKIKITDFHTWVAVDAAIADEAVRRLAAGKLKGRKVKLRRIDDLIR